MVLLPFSRAISLLPGKGTQLKGGGRFLQARDEGNVWRALTETHKKGTFPFVKLFLHLVVYCWAAADPPPPGSRVGILVAGVKVGVGGRQVAHATAEVTGKNINKGIQ